MTRIELFNKGSLTISARFHEISSNINEIFPKDDWQVKFHDVETLGSTYLRSAGLEGPQ